MAPSEKKVEDCCRLCAVETKNGTVIYSAEGVHLCLEEKIIQCLRIEVSKDDMLPKKVCSPCRSRLEDSHQFAEQANRVQHTLELLVQMKHNAEEKSFGNVDVKLEDDDIDIKDELVDLPLDVTLESDTEEAVESNVADSDEELSAPLPNRRSNAESKETSSRNSRNKKQRKTLQPQKTGSNPVVSKRRVRSRRNVPAPPPPPPVSSSSETERMAEASEEEEEEEDREQEREEEGSMENLPSEPERSPRNESLKVDDAYFRDSNNADSVGRNEKDDDEEEEEEEEEMDVNKSTSEEWKTHWGIKCNQCDQIFPFRSQFDKHYWAMYEKKPIYTCSYCGKTMEKYSTFRSHCYRHVTEGRYRCEYCQKGFSLRSMLHVHILAKHTTVKPFICEECGKGFVTRPGLNIHLKKHKTDEKVEYPCSDCGKILHTRGGLTAHQNVHKLGRRFMCDVCGKTFTQKVNMQQHVKHHTGERPFACEKCGKCFAEKSHLNRHYSFHSEKRPFQCTVCQKMYKTERCLKVHAMVHAEARPYVCTYCSKGFLSTTKLKQHYNIHTGERPYACKFCERTFTNYPNWLKHTRRRHKADPRSGVTPLKEGSAMQVVNQVVAEPQAILPHVMDHQEMPQENRMGTHAHSTETVSQLVATCLPSGGAPVAGLGMLVHYTQPAQVQPHPAQVQVHSTQVQVHPTQVQPHSAHQGGQPLQVEQSHHQALAQASLPLAQVYPEHMMTMHMAPHHHILPL